jgi:hypothetical protein
MENWQITPHFSFYQLTETSHDDLQEENRAVSSLIKNKIVKTAQLLEDVRDIVGPFIVTSGYRCPTLNKLVGGQTNSQHLRGEAADIVPWGEIFDSAFDKLIKAANAKYFEFGQMIREIGSREGHSQWIHISLGAPWRDPAKCGQVLKMIDGKYKLVAKIGG